MMPRERWNQILQQLQPNIDHLFDILDHEQQAQLSGLLAALDTLVPEAIAATTGDEPLTERDLRMMAARITKEGFRGVYGGAEYHHFFAVAEQIQRLVPWLHAQN